MKLNLKNQAQFQFQWKVSTGKTSSYFLWNFQESRMFLRTEHNSWMCSSKGTSLILECFHPSVSRPPVASHYLQGNVNCFLLFIWHKLILQLWPKLDSPSHFQSLWFSVLSANFCQVKLNNLNKVHETFGSSVS